MERAHRKGFTLVELVLVVVVIGVLAAVSYPLIQSLILEARIAQAHALAETIRTAVKIQNTSMLANGNLSGGCGTPFPSANDINANVNSQNGGQPMFNYTPSLLNHLTGTSGVQSMEVCGPAAPACADLRSPHPVYGYPVGFYYNEGTGEVWPATPDCAIFDPTALSQ